MPLTRVQSALGFALPFLFSILLVRLIVSTAGPGGLFGVGQGPISVTFSAVVDVSREPGNESDTVIAFNPADPLKGLAGYTRFGTSQNPIGIGLKKTLDGGADWVALPSLPPASDTDGTHQPFAQPAVAADATGRFFVAYMASGLTGVSIWTVVLGSDFTVQGNPIRLSPIPAPSPGFDFYSNPQIAVGPSSVPGEQIACVAFDNGFFLSQFPGVHVGCAPVAGVVPGIPLHSIPGSTEGQLPDLAIDRQGGVVVTFVRQAPFPALGAEILVSRNSDGLGSAGFEPADLVTTTNLGMFQSLPASPFSPGAGANPSPRVAVDQPRDRTYIAFADSAVPGSTDTDIFVMRADTQAATFTARVKVNDDATTNSQFLPNLAVDQTTGNVLVTFYDARNTDNTGVQLFAGLSSDGGDTWANLPATAGISRLASLTTMPGHGFGRRHTSRFHDGEITVGFADNSPGLAGNPDAQLEAVIAFGNVSPTATIEQRVIVTGAGAGGAAHVRTFDASTGVEVAGFLAFDVGFTGGARVGLVEPMITTATAFPLVLAGAGPGGGPQISHFDAITGAPVGPLVSAWPRAGLPSAFYAFDAAFRGGVFVAGGDVDCDGIGDVVAGAGENGGPEVRVFSGATGAIVRSFFAYDPAFRGGVRVAAGDVDGDGCADIVTGPGPGGGPHVKVFSGRTGALLLSFFAYDAAFTGGVWVAAGDVNGDGRADIVIGTDVGGGPHVKVFSGQDGSLLHSFFAYDQGFRGGVRVAAVDVNGDGRADIVTGAGPGGGPEVVVFDGVTLAVIRRFLAYDAAFRGGVFVAGGPP